MENPIISDNGEFSIDQIQLRENLMEILVLYPKSIQKLSTEISVSPQTIRTFLKGREIQPQVAFKLIKYINEKMVR